MVVRFRSLRLSGGAVCLVSKLSFHRHHRARFLVAIGHQGTVWTPICLSLAWSWRLSEGLRSSEWRYRVRLLPSCCDCVSFLVIVNDLKCFRKEKAQKSVKLSRFFLVSDQNIVANCEMRFLSVLRLIYPIFVFHFPLLVCLTCANHLFVCCVSSWKVQALPVEKTHSCG